MEPLSPRARAAVDAFRREGAPSPAALSQARLALAQRLHGAAEPAAEPAAHEPVRWRPPPHVIAVSALTIAALGSVVVWLHAPAPPAQRVEVAPTANRRHVDDAPHDPRAAHSDSTPAVLGASPSVARSGSAHAAQAHRTAPKGEDDAPAARPRAAELSPPRPASAVSRTVLTTPAETRSRPANAHAVAPPPASPPRAEPVRAEPVQAASDAQHAELAETPRESASAGALSTAIVQTLPSRSDADRQRTLDAEVMQVRTAFDLLRDRQPQRALSALREHARLFPHGKLKELAEVARTLALCDAGQTEAARRASEAFLMEHPSSIHAPRVRSVCLSAR